MHRPNRVPRRIPGRLTLALGALLCASPGACTDSVEPIEFTEPLDLALAWQTADPEAVGLDADALAVARSELEAIPRALSLLVAKNGRLVYEAYLHGNHADSLNDVRSVTKSVVSTLTGIALEEGLLSSLEQTLGELLPPSAGTVPPDKAEITVLDLLTMSGGFEWTEVGAIGYNEWLTSGDPVGFLLDRALSDAPGSRFNYNSAAVHLLGVMLEGATGTPIDVFADQYFFGPLGIARRRWETAFTGYPNGGSGLDMRPRDLLRFGQLALQDGVSGDRALVDADWFDAATTPHYTWRSNGSVLASGSYGYLWWTETGRARDAFLAWGYGGQFIYVVPEIDMVVVATTDWRGVGSGSGPLADDVMRVIVEQVVPAAR